MKKTFLCINFGCRVNAAETNQYSQLLIDKGFSPCPVRGRGGKGFIPDLIFINTCSVTAKANIESLGKIRSLRCQFPNAQIIVSGCADFENIKELPNISIIKNTEKEKALEKTDGKYNPQIGDKFSHTNRYLLKVQSGCTHNCSYCIVPQKRPYLWSLSIEKAVKTVNRAVKNGYKEVIITGVNLDQYQYGFSSLIESILKNTSIPLISFGSIPINCIDNKFLDLFSTFNPRLSTFLHIPIQSGSDKILKLMNRPYTKEIILEKFSNLKNLKSNLSFGTDIIVGFPGETDSESQETYLLCQQIGFSKIHTFRFSKRPSTLITKCYKSFPNLSKNVLNFRSQKIRKLCNS